MLRLFPRCFTKNNYTVKEVSNVRSAAFLNNISCFSIEKRAQKSIETAQQILLQCGLGGKQCTTLYNILLQYPCLKIDFQRKLLSKYSSGFI